ncbi:MAG: (2Fe-2S)-binding protein [Myxococcales bacterium]
MPRKLILCRCEDVTAADVDHAVATGFAELEEVKRYTGFGTGPCQGKECLRAVALQLAAVTGRPAASLQPFTTRPPLLPTALKLLTDSSQGRRGHQGDDAPKDHRGG